MSIKWDGITKSEMLRDDELVVRHQLADAAKTYKWRKTLKILNKSPSLINKTRPDGQSLYTPLHQAAYGNAPIKVVRQMIAMGAWRTFKNADGERPIDIAYRKKHHRIVQLLEPIYKTQVPLDILQDIQQHFHATILGRAERLVQKSNLRLPELEPLIEMGQLKASNWFPVPGMYGGFKYWFESEGEDAKLISSSWCRVSDGSGQRHEITSKESILVDEGFV